MIANDASELPPYFDRHGAQPWMIRRCVGCAKPQRTSNRRNALYNWARIYRCRACRVRVRADLARLCRICSAPLDGRARAEHGRWDRTDRWKLCAACRTSDAQRLRGKWSYAQRARQRVYAAAGGGVDPTLRGW